MKLKLPTRTILIMLSVLAWVAVPAVAEEETKPSTSAKWLPGEKPPADVGEEAVILLNRPKLYDSPEQAAASRQMFWAPGQTLFVLEARPDAGHPDYLWHRVRRDTVEGWMPDALLAPKPQPIDEQDVNGIADVRVDRTHGLPPTFKPENLVRFKGLSSDPNSEIILRREAGEAVKKLQAAARREKLKIYIVSAYRSWNYQQSLYERKLERSGIFQRKVAKPGHSEHQLGTTVDFANDDQDVLLTEEFGNTPEGKWLKVNAPRFGFAVTYTRYNQDETGYDPEPWHYRYWGTELAAAKHQQALGPLMAE